MADRVRYQYKRNTKMIAAYVQPDVYDRFERAALMEGESMSSLAAKLIERYVATTPDGGELPMETLRRLDRSVGELSRRVEALETAAERDRPGDGPDAR